MEAFVMAAKKKMKRKDLDQVNDDFSDFSLSSPARKIRRLDAELPPIMEDEDLEPPLMSFEQHPNPEVQPARSGPVIEELPPSAAPFNGERALVLFKPVNSPLLQHQSPSAVSVSVDPHLISGFKNRNLWASLTEQSTEDNAEAAADRERNKCMAVVPWVANQFTTPMSEPRVEAAEEMEAEVSEEATMEIDDDSSAAAQLPDQYGGELRGSDASGLPQWQHCMTPQFPPTTSSPIVWFR